MNNKTKEPNIDDLEIELRKAKELIEELQQEKLNRDIKRTTTSPVYNYSMRQTLVSLSTDENIPLFLRLSASTFIAESYAEHSKILKEVSAKK